MVQALLEAGADVHHTDVNRSTPLHHARRGDVVRLLVTAGANVNAADSWGQRPLHCAAKLPFDERNQQIMVALIEAGADVDARDKDGATPLLHACGFAVPPTVVRLLLEAGADPAVANEDGTTPLMSICEVLRSGICDAAQCVTMRRVALLLTRTEAWWRRRHALQAVRGRYGGAAPPAAPAIAAVAAVEAGTDAGAASQ